MKKITSIIFLTILTFTLTGCNKSTEVTCTQEGVKFTVYYKNNEMVKQHTETTETYNSKQQFDKGYLATQTTLEAYNSIEGITAESVQNGNTITLKVTYDIKKLNKEVLEHVQIKQKPKDLIKENEELGFTCTTK